MDEASLRLDGNALAGALEQIFSGDVTGARGQCSRCRRIAELGAQHLYRYPHAPGAVLRCAACDHVLLVLVPGPNGDRLALPGLSWFEFGDVTERSGESTQSRSGP
jgi:hypothetical protein